MVVIPNSSYNILTTALYYAAIYQQIKTGGVFIVNSGPLFDKQPIFDKLKS